MMRRLRCLLGRHRWRPVTLPGGRHVVIRCADCGTAGGGLSYVPLPKRAARRQMERDSDKSRTRSARDRAQVAKLEREADQLEREFGDAG